MVVEGQDKNKIVRNIVIFYVGTLLLAIGGGVIIAGGESAGGLLFILSPLLMVLVVRIILRDGWKDAGLRLNLKGNGGWYLFALLVYPISFAVIIGLGMLFGFTTLTASLSELIPLVLTGFAIQLIPRMLFSLSEEWAWRGYLEPRVEMLGVPDGRRHLIVGVLWGVWHFPLILSTADYTTVPMGIFLPVFTLGVIVYAFVFGQMRKASASVWPAVLMHGVANALGFALLEQNLISYNNELLGSIAPGGVMIIVVWGLIAWWLMGRKQADSPAV